MVIAADDVSEVISNTPGLIQYIVGLLFSGGLIGLILKSIYGQRHSADRVWVDARNDAKEEYAADLAKIRSDFDGRINELKAEHQREMDAMYQQIQKLHTAMGRLVSLVGPENVTEAMSIVVGLGTASSPHRHAPES